jgi:hypothetical protein
MGHFCPPGSGSGFSDLIESGSNPDPNPKHTKNLWGSGYSVRLCHHTKFEFLHFYLSFLKFSVFIYAQKSLDQDRKRISIRIGNTGFNLIKEETQNI